MNFSELPNMPEFLEPDCFELPEPDLTWLASLEPFETIFPIPDILDVKEVSPKT